MEIIRHIPQLRKRITTWKRAGYQVGLVPTMGALHPGHLSLIKQSVKETDKTVVSIFVNPLQFGPQEDFKQYPRPLRKDIKLCRQAKVDLIFYPPRGGMYHSDFKTFIEMRELSQALCGRSRPTFFRGVMTVVTKLFNIVEPHIAYFGQKDYQQALIIRQIVRDLDINLRIKVLPTVRAKDGLAISSRNDYLTLRQRHEATCLWQALKQARKLIKSGQTSVAMIIQHMRQTIKPCIQRGAGRIDYIEIVDAQTLRPIKRITRKESRLLIALAVYIGGKSRPYARGKVRLIDNIVVMPPTTRIR